MSDERGGDPVSLSESVRRSEMFSHDASGNPVTRSRMCECGRRFTQTLLSERFVAMAERHSERALSALTQQIPGFFVPVHCPPCERVDLGHAARLAGQPVRSLPFRERSHAAD